MNLFFISLKFLKTKFAVEKMSNMLGQMNYLFIYNLAEIVRYGNNFTTFLRFSKENLKS